MREYWTKLNQGWIILLCFCLISVRPAHSEVKEPSWQAQAVRYAQLMSQIKWTPIADSMPSRDGFFVKDQEYTGVPYSSVRSHGRFIGYDIYLKTFLAAVENPKSVLYTENFRGKVRNAECYYGKVCSTYTNYALQCGMYFNSRIHGPSHRSGIIEIDIRKTQGVQAGDLIYTPPTRPGGGTHIELITEVVMNRAQEVHQVRIEESKPPTTHDTLYTLGKFQDHLKSKNKKLYRITDFDAWRARNQADYFLFPNYQEDSKTPTINRTLLLDRGDWVAYELGQSVTFNIMDRDRRGIQSLIITREGDIIETLAVASPTIVTRKFAQPGDYQAYCQFQDGSKSQACEFSLASLEFVSPPEKHPHNTPLDLHFRSDHSNIILIKIMSKTNRYGRYHHFVSDSERSAGIANIPATLLQDKGGMQFTLIGEGKYGRLKAIHNLKLD